MGRGGGGSGGGEIAHVQLSIILSLHGCIGVPLSQDLWAETRGGEAGVGVSLAAWGLMAGQLRQDLLTGQHPSSLLLPPPPSSLPVGPPFPLTMSTRSSSTSSSPALAETCSSTEKCISSASWLVWREGEERSGERVWGDVWVGRV